MTHVRQQLREAVFNAISTSPEVLALVEIENIQVERAEPFQTDDVHSGDNKIDFPAINIVANDDETDQAFMTACSKYEVNQELAVEIYVDREFQYGSKIDEIVVAVQKALFVNIKLGLNITGVKYNGSRMSFEQKETIFATRVLSYTYEYRVKYSDPEIFV